MTEQEKELATLEMLEMLCLIYGRLRAVGVSRFVTIDGHDDPKRKDGAIVYEFEMTVDEYEHLIKILLDRLNKE